MISMLLGAKALYETRIRQTALKYMINGVKTYESETVTVVEASADTTVSLTGSLEC